MVDCYYRDTALVSHPPICVSLLEKVQVRESQPDTASVLRSLSAHSNYIAKQRSLGTVSVSRFFSFHTPS